MTTAIQKKNSIEEFGNLVQAGMDAWTKAGKMLVEMLEDDPNIRARIIEEIPMMTLDALARFEQIGRGVLHPRLMVANNQGLARLRSLPYAEQVRCLNEPIAVLTPSGDELMVRAENMSAAQIRQVFTKDGCRDLGAQKNWIESRKNPLHRKSEKADYKVSGNKVTFFADTQLTRKQLAHILEELA